MHRFMRARTLWLVVGLLALPAAGCSKKSKPAKMTEEERSESERRRESTGKKVRKERADKMAAAVCDALECNDEQRTKVEELVTAHRVGGVRPRRGLGGEHEATKALADAFRKESLDASVFTEFRKAENEAREKSQTKRRDGTAEALVELHAMLSPEQRKKLAAMVVEDGLGFLRVPRRAGPRLDAARRTPPDPEQRAERMAMRLCKQVSCSGDQTDTVAGILAKLSPDRGDDNPEANAALAIALEGESLDAAKVEAYYDARDGGRTSVEAANDSVWIELHGALDSEQRAALADQVEEHGVGALMGQAGRTRRLGRMGRGRG